VKLGSDKVLIERTDAPATTEGGLLKIPDAMREKPDFGIVLEVGSKVTDWEKGDRVLYPKWSGFVVNVPNDKRDLLVLFADEIWLALEVTL
jgi:co-chaperonin GroES (HSP10)